MRKVLLVDDAAFTRSACARLLAGEGFHVEEAATGLQALAKFQEIQPDLVLMDVTMPEMDGITATREIKRRAAEAKVIVVSAITQSQTVYEALRAGASDFVAKPYSPDQILTAIRRVLAG